MPREMIEIPLTPAERALLLRYGYPLEQMERALKACAVSQDVEIVPISRFELEHLIGDVCRSINHMHGGATQDRLLDLCDRLEAIERTGDGMWDVL